VNRRGVLKSVATAAAGAAWLTSSGEVATAQEKKDAVSARVRSMVSIQTDDGVGLFYREWGTGKPLVFAAPWGLHSDWWEYQMAYLAGQGLRCVAYDRRGHGRSGEPRGGYDFDRLADDLETVLRQLDLSEVTLIGQSMGAGEVIRYLSRHGTDRIARVVLVAPITPFLLKTSDNPDGIDSHSLEKVHEALSSDRPHVITSAAPAFFGAPTNVVSAEMMQWWTAMLLHCPLRVMLDLHRVFTETDFRAELRAVALPTLVIHGDRDASAPIDITGRKTARLIHGSQLKVYAGAAHGLPITHMSRLNHDLATFVQA
jgi:non-heme chloroperoxidase